MSYLDSMERLSSQLVFSKRHWNLKRAGDKSFVTFIVEMNLFHTVQFFRLLFEVVHYTKSLYFNCQNIRPLKK